MAPPTTARTAILYDPHPLWLEGVRDVLARVGVEVVAVATTPEHALALVREHLPTLFVTGVDTVGTAHLSEAHVAVPELRSVVLSASEASEDVEAAFAAGASAYVLKSAQADDVATAVRQAFNPSVFTTFVAGCRVADVPAADEPVPMPALTRRQLEILRLVAEGRSNAEVARLLWVTEQTVKFHLANVYRKLGVANRTEASRWAHEHGILADPTPALAA
jgi:DNA-binding NarL/FixJ family response regulator